MAWPFVVFRVPGELGALREFCHCARGRERQVAVSDGEVATVGV